jgi:flagellar biosynthetic protein FliP
MKYSAIILILLAATVLAAATPVLGQPAASPAPAKPAAADPSTPSINDLVNVAEKATGGGKGNEWSSPVKLAIVFAGLALLPSLLVMVTSFTRIVIVLGFIRRALTTQTIPPTIAIIGLALFLTLYTMSATFAKINTDAVQPYLHDKIGFEDACSRSCDEIKQFMLRQTRQSDLALFVNMAGIKNPSSAQEIPLHVAVPSFAISEFRTAFEMGCLIFIPFLIVDIVISAILLSAGMMMLPPTILSLPFKIILFVLVDGWRLTAKALVAGFH